MMNDSITGTAALIVNSAGQYLLHLRDDRPICDPFVFSLLGGAPENGESPEMAIVRELKEEAGLDIPDLVPFGLVGSPGRRIQVFLGHWDGDAAALPLSEGILVHWFDYDKLPDLKLSPGTRKIIDKHRAHLTNRPHPSAVHDPTAATTALELPDRRRARPSGVGGHLYLVVDGRVLLGKRSPTARFAPSTWHALAGHLDDGESVRSCVAREACEEAGLLIAEGELDLVHVVHLREGNTTLMEMFFRPRRWVGEPQLREPDKCTEWKFFGLDALPEDLVPYTRAALEGIAAGRPYTELGWEA
ncbi:MAG: NUDIX hydrolase [Streptomycetaceae bacterium]|nr:NUDIX hydrolase [Streptomycetaceae bacterium]